VDNSLVARGYMKPDIDLRGYTAIMLDPVEVAYHKDPGNTRRATDPRASNSNFALDATQMENLKALFLETVVEALSEDDGYRIVDDPAPEVLRISAGLLDLIVRVPTQRGAGRERTFVASYGVVTLIVEARDSESGEILARAAERSDLTQGGNRDLVEVSSTFVGSEARRLFRQYAGLLRERLDELRNVERDPGQ